MTRRISRRLSFNTVSLALTTTDRYMGIAIAPRIAMIVITIINSSSVKPLLPIFVLRSIQSNPIRFSVNIEDVLSAPGEHLRVILITAQAPLRGVCHGIERNTAQEFQFLVDGADHLH